MPTRLISALALTLTGLFSTPLYADIAASVTVASGSSATISPSEQTLLEIVLSNSNSAAPISSVGFSNVLPGTLPNGLLVDAAASYVCFDPDTSATSPGAGSLTAAPGGQGISLGAGVIPARANGVDGSCTITVPITAGTSDGSFRTDVVTIASGDVTGNDGSPVSNSGDVSQSINVRAVPQPRITQHVVSNNNTLILGGDAQTLTFTITNTADVAIPNFDFRNDFPLVGGSNAFELASTPNATGSCSDASTPTFSGPPTGGDAGIRVNGTLPANGSCTFSVDVSALTTDNLFSTLVTNAVNRFSDWSNDIGVTLAANASRVITLQSPLTVDVDFPNLELSSGESDVLTMTWVNLANSPLSISSFSDDPFDGVGNGAFGLKLDANPTMVCSSGAPGSFVRTGGDTGFQLTGPMILAAGATCTTTVPFTGTVQTPGTTSTFTNTVDDSNFTVGAIGAAQVVAQSTSDSILVGDDVRISIDSDPNRVAPNQPIRYEVTIENFGPGAIANLTLTDVLPTGATFLAGSFNGFDYTPTLAGSGCTGLSNANATGDGTVTVGLGSLPGRVNTNTPSACVITYYAQAPAGTGSTTNNLPAGALTWNGGGQPKPHCDDRGEHVGRAALRDRKEL